MIDLKNTLLKDKQILKGEIFLNEPLIYKKNINDEINENNLNSNFINDEILEKIDKYKWNDEEKLILKGELPENPTFCLYCKNELEVKHDDNLDNTKTCNNCNFPYDGPLHEMQKYVLSKTDKIILNNPKQCFYCENEVSEDKSVCNNCNFPLKSNLEEKQKYVLNKKGMFATYNILENTKTHNKNLLLSVSGLLSIVSILFFYKSGISIGSIYLVIGLFFAGMAFWSQKSPFPAIFSGFLIFILIIISSIAQNPLALYDGLIIKSILFGYFYKGSIESQKYEIISKYINKNQFHILDYENYSFYKPLNKILVFLSVILIYLVSISIFRIIGYNVNVFAISIGFANIILFYYLFDLEEVNKLLNFKIIKIRTLLESILIALLYAIFIYFAVKYLYIYFGEHVNTLKFSLGKFISNVIGLAILPAIFEEIACRGFIFNELLKLTSLKNTIILSSILFFILHLTLISFLWLIPLSLYLGYLRAKHRTIIYGIIVHFIYNFTLILLETRW